ncbi:hypothetical protein F7725_027167 [Dissostichus mawsoni]|uniref:Uncharacterized protein n=1 Tax=Dissostichus mawsoni TaxID=36200 RepID=A0A7J5XD44_DISMA|nr:hypothetical protein F7725_027167 [Dissostichus mawsoni]
MCGSVEFLHLETIKTSNTGGAERGGGKMLQKAMCCYTADTLNYIDTVKAFCEQSSKWMLQRRQR